MIAQLSDKRTFNEYRGLSGDTKPVTDTPNGSIYREIDTSITYMFDSESRNWYSIPAGSAYKIGILSRN